MIHTIATQPDSSHPLNPSNYDYTDRGPEFCAYCGVADPEHLTNIGSARHPEEVCDSCMVENAANCGDWTAQDIEAAKRMNVLHPELPTA